MKKGFTFIEVLIVVAVIAILISAVIPALSEFFGTGSHYPCGK